MEHGITEMVTGVDLVCWQYQLQGAPKAPAGSPPGSDMPANLSTYVPALNGHAIELRICAEDPGHNYRPCTGVLGLVAWPTKTEARVDTWVETGVEVSGECQGLPR